MLSKIKLDKIYPQDCLQLLKKLKKNSIDLIITSPLCALSLMLSTKEP